MAKTGRKKKSKKRKKTPRGRTPLTARGADRHILYEESVQCVEADLDFFAKTYRRRHGRLPVALKEDFCGTAALACEWIRRGAGNTAWGVDLDQPTLDWGMEHHVSTLDDEQRRRLTLVCEDVLRVTEPKFDVVAALNFSYQVFHTRPQLLAYFQAARESLADDGVFIVDCFGGTEAFDDSYEERTIKPEKRRDGTRFENFTYCWEQVRFNPIDHHLVAHIHFEFADGTRVKKAFSYDWRLWTLPELQELMVEAGLRDPEVYTEGWDEDDEPDGKFRRKKRMENVPGWVGYVVGYR